MWLQPSQQQSGRICSTPLPSAGGNEAGAASSLIGNTMWPIVFPIMSNMKMMNSTLPDLADQHFIIKTQIYSFTSSQQDMQSP